MQFLLSALEVKQMNNINQPYNQVQVENRATYCGLYLYYSVHTNLSGHSLRVAVAEEMRYRRALSGTRRNKPYTVN